MGEKYLVIENSGEELKKYLDRGGVVDKVASGKVQADYNENDATQPDYIKNKPFYSEMISVEAELTNDLKNEWDENIYIPLDTASVSRFRDFSEERTPVSIEVLYNNNVYREKGFLTIDGGFLNEYSEDGIGVDFDDCNILFNCMTDNGIEALHIAESLDGISIKIYRETLKKIDKKYLPPNDVPYIYSEDGSVRLHDLDTGVYVLHGSFELGYPNEGIWFEESFTYRPTLCQLINDKDEMFIKMSWVDADPENGLVGKYTEIYGSEVNASDVYALMDVYTLAEEASSMAYDAVTIAEDASGAVADAYSMAEEALSASDAGVEARDSIIMLSNGDYPLPTIVLNDENGDSWYLMVDSSGKVNTIKA